MKGQKIIDIATKEIGYAEQPINKTKYGLWFGLNGVSWCGIFVSWCYAQADSSLGNIGYTKGYAGVSTAIVHFKKTGEITTKPQLGDVFFIGFKAPGIYEHTGIFVKDNLDGTFESIEGNTSASDGSQSNGGQVARKVRKFNMSMFVHPKCLDAI